MPSISTLGSPGVEVREYDESLRTVTSAGTTVFIPGFASQGPVEEINPIGSMDEFEIIYGQPTNAAERYFYYTVKAVLDSSGAGTTVLTSRLPYGAGDGDNVSNAFTILAYPALPIIKNKDNEKGYDYYEVDESGIEDLKTLLTLTSDRTDKIDPESVNANIILNSANHGIGVNISKFELVDEYLPNFLDNDRNLNPSISYTLTKDDGETVVEGKSFGSVITELKGGQSIVRFAFTLHDGSDPIGIATFDAVYDIDEDDELGSVDIHSYTLADDEVENGVELKPINAFETSDEVTYNASGDVTYLIGSPTTFQISLNEYYQLLSGELFAWSNKPNKFTYINTSGDYDKNDDEVFGMYKALRGAAFIAVNPSRTIINDSFEGYYLGLTDNIFNQSEDGHTYNAIDSIKITTLSTNTSEVSAKQDETKNPLNVGLLDDQFQIMNKGRLDFYLDSNNKGSVSQVIQNEITPFDTSSDEYDDTINLGLFKIKKSATASEVMKLTYSLVERYNASLGKSRQYSISTSTEPKTYFLENILEDSINLTVLVNPYIAENIYLDSENNLRGKVRVYSNKLASNLDRYEAKYITNYRSGSANTSTMNPARVVQSNISSWATIVERAGISPYLLDKITKDDTTYNSFTKANSLYPFGVYTVTKTSNKFIGSVPTKLNRTLNLVANDEEYPDIDIICEGGLGTIYAYSNTKELINVDNSSAIVGLEENEENTEFDDTVIPTGIEDMRTGRSSYSEYAQNVIEDFTAVQNSFLKIANSETNGGRGNTFYIADVLRGILVKGKNTKVSSLFGSRLSNNSYDDEDVVNHSWSTSIYYPIKHLTDSFVSSFTSMYAQYFKILDDFSGEKMWVPASGFVAGRMCAVDQVTGPWEAAAGLNRGGVPGVLDVAISPTLNQRSDLYKICINSIPSLPNVGPTIWGIRTMSKKASAFDQNTCRRTFLYIEKVIKQTLRYFLFERNDSYTQLQVYNELEPFLDSLKKQRAIYSYRLVCDATNNTEEIVNNGDMVVDVAAAPERTAENIILNVTANRYTQAVDATISTIG